MHHRIVLCHVAWTLEWSQRSSVDARRVLRRGIIHNSLLYCTLSRFQVFTALCVKFVRKHPLPTCYCSTYLDEFVLRDGPNTVMKSYFKYEYINSIDAVMDFSVADDKRWYHLFLLILYAHEICVQCHFVPHSWSVNNLRGLVLCVAWCVYCTSWFRARK